MKIAIIGAGLNGLALAVMLKRFGLESRVFEKAYEPRDAGSGIYVWPQGVQVLKFILNGNSFLDFGHPIESLDTHNRAGRLIHSQLVKLPGFDFPVSAVMFHRKNLFHMLRQELGSSQINCGKEVAHIEDTPNGSTVTFTDGSVEDFSLVVGADGVNSTVRRFISSAQPVDSGIAASRGMVNFSNPLLNNDVCQVFTHDHARLVTYCLNPNLNQRYWFVAYLHNNEPLLNKQQILERLEGHPEPLLKMIETTDESNILNNTLHTMKVGGNWYRNSNVLLGDSAHAMLPSMGYGITLGLENGFMLAQALVGCEKQELPAALQRYQARVIQRSADLVKVMDDVSTIFYREREDQISEAALHPVINRFCNLATTTPF